MCIRGEVFALQLPETRRNMFSTEQTFIACQNKQIWWNISNIHLLVKCSLQNWFPFRRDITVSLQLHHNKQELVIRRYRHIWARMSHSGVSSRDVSSRTEQYISGVLEEITQSRHMSTLPIPPAPCPTLSAAKVGATVLSTTDSHSSSAVKFCPWSLFQLQYPSTKHKLMRLYPWPDKEREALLCQQFNPVMLSHFIGWWNLLSLWFHSAWEFTSPSYTLQKAFSLCWVNVIPPFMGLYQCDRVQKFEFV